MEVGTVKFQFDRRPGRVLLTLVTKSLQSALAGATLGCAPRTLRGYWTVNLSIL